MPKRKKVAEVPQQVLDIIPGKRGRGRPGVRASEISGRAYHYRLIFNRIWDSVGEALLRSRTEDEVIQAFGSGCFYLREFAPIASLILEVLRDADFPKRKPAAKINFLADSLAAHGQVTPRTSRDICERERMKERAKSRRKILRWEFYILCSCGHKGPALNGACPKCGSEIPSGPDMVLE